MDVRKYRALQAGSEELIEQGGHRDHTDVQLRSVLVHHRIFEMQDTEGTRGFFRGEAQLGELSERSGDGGLPESERRLREGLGRILRPQLPRDHQPVQTKPDPALPKSQL